MNCIALVGQFGEILGFPYHKSLFTSKFKGGRIAHFEGRRIGIHFWGVVSPTLGKRPPCVSPHLPKKGTWGNVSPDVPQSWVRGVCAPDPGGRVPVEHCLLHVVPWCSSISLQEVLDLTPSKSRFLSWKSFCRCQDAPYSDCLCNRTTNPGFSTRNPW